jgi:hypothetical protein
LSIPDPSEKLEGHAEAGLCALAVPATTPLKATQKPRVCVRSPSSKLQPLASKLSNTVKTCMIVMKIEATQLGTSKEFAEVPMGRLSTFPSIWQQI